MCCLRVEYQEMNNQTRERLLQYFATKASPQTLSIVRKFFKIIGQERAPLEVSSESGLGRGRDYVRLALSCLRRDQVLELLSGTKHKQELVKQFMMANPKDPCFGLGIADYGLRCDEQRIKLYNYYELSSKKDIGRGHLLKLCRKTNVPCKDVERDINYFERVRMSAVDFYDNGEVNFKAYYGPFRPKDILSKFQGLFSPRANKKYGQWMAGEQLFRLLVMCVRYSRQGRSVRTDFWCQTRKILPYLKEFDLQGDAKRLYKDLCGISLDQILTFVCIDLDKRPRTQLYFFLGDL
jgi:hypothetical protein